MERLNFVDVHLNQLTEAAEKEERYAIDLGIGSRFGGEWLPGENCHCFVSAEPWLKGVNKKAAIDFCRKLEEINPDVKFALLYLEQISLLNTLGKNQDFRILNCWTRSTCDDWHGRVDGYYSLTNGRSIVDWGENETDVYFVFAFIPGQEKSIVRA